MPDVVDLFAGGPGGWSIALSQRGLTEMGFEHDKDAIMTRAMAGFATTPGDIRLVSDTNAWGAKALVASPPCTTFSRLGAGAGRKNLDKVVAGLAEVVRGRSVEGIDEVTALVLEPMRWIVRAVDEGTPYRWIAFEQVPSVLPVWEEYARLMEVMGYYVWTGSLSSEMFGVPQTRKRAVLMAHLDRPMIGPKVSHQKYKYGEGARRAYGLSPWVSMRDALGETMPEVNNQSGTDFDLTWQYDQPASVVAGRHLIPFRGANANRFNGSTKSRNDGWKVTTRQMGLLQGFPERTFWHGGVASAAKQIGNAIPPQMAGAIIDELV